MYIGEIKLENQRIRLTKQLLRNALIKLLHQKSINTISVTELCHTAQINRVTFYKYYNNPTDVLTEIKDNILLNLNKKIATYQENSLHLISALRFLQEHQDEFITLMKNMPGNELEEDLFYSSELKKILSEKILDNYDECDKEKAYLFICSGSYSVIRKWILEGCQETPNNIAEFIHLFAQKLL